MRQSFGGSRRILGIVLALAWCPLASGRTAMGAEEASVEMTESSGKVHVRVGEVEIATYAYEDPQTPRPYFTALKSAAGTPLTRNHPPQPGDRDDHPLMHPGLWRAFGDLNGADGWRLKAQVRHVEFLKRPAGGGFAVRNRYLAADGKTALCSETVRYRFLRRPSGVLLLWDSTLEADAGPVRLGEQEEMGLGVRVATPLAVSSGRGGRLLDSEGRRDEKAIWGNVARWCDYSGPAGNGWAGITLMTASDNVRGTWWHVRDYGVFVANSFGPRSKGGPAEIAAGEPLRLRYGVLLHETAAEGDLDLAAEFGAFEKGLQSVVP